MTMELEAKVLDHESRIERLEQRQDKMDALVETMAVMKTKQENIENDVVEIKSDVKKLTEKPLNTWESLREKVLWFFVGGILVLALASIGIHW